MQKEGVNVHRSICLLSEIDTALGRMTEIFGGGSDFAELEERLLFKPEMTVGNLNYAVNSVEFCLFYTVRNDGSLAANMKIRYLGSPSFDNTAVTAMESYAEPGFREYLKNSGFKVTSDILKIGRKFNTRLGFDISIYQPNNCRLSEDQMKVSSVGKEQGIIICEFTISADTEKFQSRKNQLDHFFKLYLQDIAISDLTYIKYLRR